MKLCEIYFSPTGGTKKVSDLLTSAWAEQWESLDLSDPQFPMTGFSKNDLCILSVPSFGGRVPDTAVQRLKKIQGNGAKAILVVVYGNRAYEDTLLELKDIAEQIGFSPVAAVAAIAEHSIMHQFAAGRPDKEDCNQLRSFSEKLKEHIISVKDFAPLSVPGNYPYKEYHTIPFYPRGNQTCTSCGICTDQCPVGAIPQETPSSLDEKRCIACMRCISVCPQKARGLDPTILEQTAKKMAPLFSERKSNELFLAESK